MEASHLLSSVGPAATLRTPHGANCVLLRHAGDRTPTSALDSFADPSVCEPVRLDMGGSQASFGVSVREFVAGDCF